MPPDGNAGGTRGRRLCSGRSGIGPWRQVWTTPVRPWARPCRVTGRQPQALPLPALGWRRPRLRRPVFLFWVTGSMAAPRVCFEDGSARDRGDDDREVAGEPRVGGFGGFVDASHGRSCFLRCRVGRRRRGSDQVCTGKTGRPDVRVFTPQSRSRRSPHRGVNSTDRRRTIRSHRVHERAAKE